LLKGPARYQRYSVPLWDITEAFPYISYEGDQERKNAQLERRKLRIMMRGIKIGRKKGGAKISLMSVFEKKE